MDTIILSIASCYNQKYFLNPLFRKLPEEVKKEIKIISVCIAQKIHGIFIMGFYDDGSIYLRTEAIEGDFDYDEVGAGLEVERIKREEKELLNSLCLSYKILFKSKGVKNENR